MINFLLPEEKKLVSIFCNKLVNNKFNVEDVIQSIDIMARVTSKILPKPLEGTLYESTIVSILIDDILSATHITKEEQIIEISKLIDINKEKLQFLAQQILSKIEINIKEAEERGYCSRLIDKDK